MTLLVVIMGEVKFLIEKLVQKIGGDCIASQYSVFT